MNFAVLKTEIDTDPLGRGYAAMSAEEVAHSLNTADREIACHARKTLRDLVASTDMTTAATVITKLESAAESNPVVQVTLDACKDYSGNGGVDFSHPSTITAINTLQSQGVFTSEEASLLLSLGKRSASRATELGLPEIKVGQVERARNG